MLSSAPWRLLVGLVGLLFAAGAVAAIAGGAALIGLAVLPLGLAMLAGGLWRIPRSGDLGAVRAGTFAVRGAQVHGLMLVPSRRRLGLGAAVLLGFGLTWTALLVALAQETVVGGLVVGWPGPFMLALAVRRASQLAAPERAGVLLTVDGVTLDGGRHWAEWDDLTGATVFDGGRGQRTLMLRTGSRKKPLQLAAGATDADLALLEATLTRLARDRGARELLPTATEITVRMLATG